MTPVLSFDGVHLKAENRQRAGAFKFRGAFNRLSQIQDGDLAQGVVAVSSGNHGAAVATAAQILGISATIFTPKDAPKAKLDLMVGAGATVRTFDRSIPDREAPARAFAEETGATFIHPYEDSEIMAGAGTTALELHGQLDKIDHLYVPMGGGGLMAGCASVMSVLNPRCRLMGVEPAMADDTRRSFEAGEPVTIPAPQTIADGLAVPRPGENTFSINSKLVSRVITVSEDEIIESMKAIFDATGEVVEPSGAVALAGVFKIQPDGKTVALITGGNVDREQFPQVFSR